LEKFWNDTREKIKKDILPEKFESWFEPTYPKRLSNGLLMVACPNQFVRKSLIENYRGLIEKTLMDIRGSPILVDFCIERGG